MSAMFLASGVLEKSGFPEKKMNIAKTREPPSSA